MLLLQVPKRGSPSSAVAESVTPSTAERAASSACMQVPTGRRPRPFAPPVLVPVPPALQARALHELRTELCFLREATYAGADLHAGRSTAARDADRWMHELGVAFVQVGFALGVPSE